VDKFNLAKISWYLFVALLIRNILTDGRRICFVTPAILVECQVTERIQVYAAQAQYKIARVSRVEKDDVM
jgi:hypothetical protein